MENKLIRLKIISSKGQIFSDWVSSLSAYNQKGYFDILPLHANFISLVYKQIIYRDAVTSLTHEVKINEAVLKVFKDEATVYLGT